MPVAARKLVRRAMGIELWTLQCEILTIEQTGFSYRDFEECHRWKKFPHVWY
jgi:hypothetical protein